MPIAHAPMTEPFTDPIPDPWSGLADPAAERRHRLERLAATFRLFAHHGFDEGLAGHITVRDPEHLDTFWVNPFAVDFAAIRVSDLVRVGADGTIVENGAAAPHGVNRSAFAIHSRIHAARPDVVAAAHSHSRAGRAWSALGRSLAPITQDHCDFHGDHAVYDAYRGVVRDTDEGDAIAAALGMRKAAILRNHGLLTVGHTVEEAAWWFLRLERCCEISLAAEAAGQPTEIDDRAARSVHAQQGSALAGWFTAQPLYDRILADQPDLLD